MTEGRLSLRASLGLQTPAPSAANDGFVPVTGVKEQQVSAGSMVIAAYLSIWVIMVGFIFLSVRRMRELELQAERLAAVAPKH